MTIGRRSRASRGLLARLAFVVGAVGMMSALSIGVAWAHAERLRSVPEQGTKLDKAPAELSIDFTEPPTGDANLVVMDGCETDVVQELQVQDTSVSASLAEGQPGTWVVRSTVVSGVDGHQTNDSWSFTVKGSKDCSAPSEATDQARDEGDSEDESSLPVVPVAIGAVAVLGIALLLRALTGRSSD